MRKAIDRNSIKAAIGLAALLVMAACGTSGGSSGGSSEGGKTVRIGVGIDASYAPFFLAEEKGMFKDAGVNVELVQFGRGGEAVQAIAGGQVDIAGNSDTTTLAMMRENPKLQAMFIYQQSGRYLKVVARPGVTGADKIKKMGVVPGLSDYMARKYFESAGVALDSVEFVEAAPPELPTLAVKGDVDAYLLWEPWGSKGVEQGLKELTDTGSYGYSYVHWAVADSTWLGDNEDDAAKIAQVLAKSTDMVSKDPAGAAKAVESQAKIKATDAQQAIELVDWKVRGFTDDDLKSYDEQVQYLVDKGIFKKALDYRSEILVDWYNKHSKAS